MTIARRSSLRQRLFAVLVAGIGAVAASAVSFTMAIYEAANPEPPRVVEAGEPIDTGRWIVAVHEARIGAASATGPKTFVTVEFDIVNRSSASAHASMNLVAIDPPVPGVSDPTLYLARDGQIASPLNPGMTERLIAAWEWPDTQSRPRELGLVIGTQIYKRRDNLYGASGWFDRDPVAVVRLPLQDAGEAMR